MTADKHNRAIYWSREHQQRRLIDAYERWDKHGGVWNAAAAKTHEEQLGHVQKGCLARAHQNVASDGSQIEGSHKGWNNLQRLHASGLEVLLTALGHDHVLRWNIHIVSDCQRDPLDPFLSSTHRSHHIRLVDSVAKLWNTLLEDEAVKKLRGLRCLPEMQAIDSGEVFGLIQAQYATTYHNLTCSSIKAEPDEELLDLSLQDEVQACSILEDLSIDPVLYPQLANDSPVDAAAPPFTSESHTDNPLLTQSSPLSPALATGPVASVSKQLAPISSLSSMPLVIDLSSDESDTATIRHSSKMESAVQELQDQDVREGVSERWKGKAKDVEGPPSTAPVPPTSRSMQLKKVDDIQDVECGKFLPGVALKRKATSDMMPQQADTAGHGSKKVRVLESMQAVPGVAVSIAESTTHMNKSKSTTEKKKKASATVHPFFVAQRSAGNNKPARRCAESMSAGTSESALILAQVLPPLQIDGLTRSQRIFSISTEINAASLSISTDAEFYLFMDMWAEHKWASFNMSPSKWVAAAEAFNACREVLNGPRGLPMIRKTPRALMDKLGELKLKVLSRINSKNYTCSHENHNKSYCADGVMQKPKKVERHVNGQAPEMFMEDPPEFPQPRDIFTTGMHFHLDIFLKTIKHMYQQLIVQKGSGGDLSMEYIAFAGLLSKRLKVHEDGMALFELYGSLETASASRWVNSIIERNGIKYLRVDYLRDNAEAAGSLVVASAGREDL
ncbi:hypothetical protein SCP_0605050 [Sparassis crispa]|uniref:Uncharacterized protein n=1 Tax=Sparassis crispa TaxID=139825 RepID=A0A401GQN0_9APHY|nr:hypothetical protein SCP_0605050 [Sparassis crispa]GBE84526.1 hypothetical protein SCP_0605050 [Sparassis crispa]